MKQQWSGNWVFTSDVVLNENKKKYSDILSTKIWRFFLKPIRICFRSSKCLEIFCFDWKSANWNENICIFPSFLPIQIFFVFYIMGMYMHSFETMSWIFNQTIGLCISIWTRKTNTRSASIPSIFLCFVN